MSKTPVPDGNGDPIVDYSRVTSALDREMFDRLPLARRHASIFFYLACRVEYFRVTPFPNTPEVNAYRAVYDPSRGHRDVGKPELDRLTRWLNHTGFLDAFCLRDGNPRYHTGEALPLFLYAGAYDLLHPADAATLEPYENVASHPVELN